MEIREIELDKVKPLAAAVKKIAVSSVILAVVGLSVGCSNLSEAQSNSVVFPQKNSNIQQVLQSPVASTREVPMVVYRAAGDAKDVVSVYLNDHVVGTLKSGQYAYLAVCAKGATIKLQSKNNDSLSNAFFAKPPKTDEPMYIKVLSDGSNLISAELVSKVQADTDLASSEASDVINRHIASGCAPEQITLDADALFDSGKSNLNKRAMASMQELVSTVRAKSVNLRQINVIGHADRMSGDAYNMKLSAARANTVAQYLRNAGLSMNITSEGRGEREPVSQGCSDKMKRSALIACLQPDRRVVIQLIGEVDKP